MENKNKPSIALAILIDVLLIILFSIIAWLLLYITYNIHPYPRIVSALVILACIPITWGTIIASAMEKKTIGHRVANKIAEKKNKK